MTFRRRIRVVKLLHTGKQTAFLFRSSVFSGASLLGNFCLTRPFQSPQNMLGVEPIAIAATRIDNNIAAAVAASSSAIPSNNKSRPLPLAFVRRLIVSLLIVTVLGSQSTRAELQSLEDDQDNGTTEVFDRIDGDSYSDGGDETVLKGELLLEVFCKGPTI